MKGVLGLMFAVFAGICFAEAGGDFRIFTAADGRVIEARILEYNPSRNQLRIERNNGAKVWINPGTFAVKDQPYIEEWIVGNLFCENEKFRVAAQMKKESSTGSDNVHYDVMLQNLSGFPYNDVRVEYRVYIDQKGYAGKADSKRCVGGRIDFGTLENRDKQTRSTDPESLAEVYETVTETWTDYDIYGNPIPRSSTKKRKVRQDNVQGALFRIYGPTVAGKPVMREYAIPSGFGKDVVWEDKGPPVALRTQAPPSRNAYKDAIREADKYREGKDGVKKDPKKALEILQKAFGEEANGLLAYKIGHIYLHTPAIRDLPKAEDWMLKAAELKYGYGCNVISMFYSCNRNAPFHDGAKALRFALMAVELSDSHHEIDTLACAYARTGDFGMAVKTQEKAYGLAKEANGSAKTLEMYAYRLELFRQGKAWAIGMKPKQEEN
ncbi:SEL1-like repeat protein [Pontiella desulfatans]|nr:hypothetical protein [Pontiella desulfatans]